MICYGMIPNINKLTRLTANTTTFIDYFITNVIIDHFDIILAFQIGEKKMCDKFQQHIHE